MNHGYHESRVFSAQRRNVAHKVVKKKQTGTWKQSGETGLCQSFKSDCFTESFSEVTYLMFHSFVFYISNQGMRWAGYTENISVIFPIVFDPPKIFPLRVTHPQNSGGKHMDPSNG